MFARQKLLLECRCTKGNNDNNDNNNSIHAGVIFDAGGGAETSFQLTVALEPIFTVPTIT